MRGRSRVRLNERVVRSYMQVEQKCIDRSLKPFLALVPSIGERKSSCPRLSRNGTPTHSRVHAARHTLNIHRSANFSQNLKSVFSKKKGAVSLHAAFRPIHKSKCLFSRGDFRCAADAKRERQSSPKANPILSAMTFVCFCLWALLFCFDYLVVSII